MNHLSSQTYSSSLDEYIPEYIQTDWLTAITNLYRYHHQLVTYISQKLTQPEWRVGTTTYIDQCPVSQLMDLVNTMRQELRKLDQDMDQPEKFRRSTSSKNYGKLAAHTRVLNHLNQQARRGLYLVAWSTP